MLAIRKDSLADDKARLAGLLSRMEAKVARAFHTFIERATSDDAVKVVIELVQRGNIEAALAVVDQHIATMASAITAAFQDSAAAEAVAIMQQALAAERPAISIAFDPTNPRAAALMRNERLEFVREFTNEQRAVMREAIATGLQAGDGPRQIATDFRASIGLTRRQEAAVANYRRLLTMGSAEALQRDLRDRRFDGSVRRAADGTRPLTPEQIDKQVERYRQRMLVYRSENIARTEAGRALSLGRQEAMQQSIDAGIVSPSDVEQLWNVILDGREREWHETMSRQVQPWGQPFIDGKGNRLRFPHDPNAPADTVIGCRCNVTYRIKKAA